MQSKLLSLTAMLALTAGCADVSFTDYYPNDGADGPSVDEISPTSEAGSWGGQTVTITGSGFGETENLLLISQHNVEIVSWSDSEIVAISPDGPITGGKTGVLVATAEGWDELGDEDDESGYVYDMAELSDASYDGENGYILLQNFYNSCYGGLSADSIPGAGCETISYIGQSGLDGTAEFYKLVYPRVHTTGAGFVSGGLPVGNEWRVAAGSGAATAFPSGIDDLRERIGSFTMVNEEWAGVDQCVDLENGTPVKDTQCGPGTRKYDIGEVQFCEDVDASDGANYTYLADYPVDHDFFSGATPLTGGTVVFDSDDNRIDGLELTFPPPLIIDAEAGVGDEEVWMVSGELASCPDTTGDGEALLNEPGLIVTWDPIPDPDSIGGQCDTSDCEVTAASFVQISMSYLNMGWFGGEGAGVIADIVVDDQSGRVTVPNDVLYQFPTPNSAWSNSNQTTGTGYLGTVESNAAFVVLEFTRITDYRIDDGEGNVTVVSYVTGDFTFPAWTNPAESGDDCGDCLDGDADGWTDDRDPDCATGIGGNGDVEDDTNTDFTCNDGLDNDGDGLIDADDVDQCVNGWDGETTCGDGIDNDGDGWTDGLDGECPEGDAFASEIGEDDVAWTCSDGLDNDGDGWFDADDPGCADGTGFEDDGFGTNECNDGIDNDDIDDLVDAEDPYCMSEGATAETETAIRLSQCTDGVDNDGDGMTDEYDPDCEFSPPTRETTDFMDPEDAAQPWFGHGLQCYDGLDNDGDGAVDGADASCWDPANTYGSYLVNGFISDEATDHGTTCSDGIDTDGDGWIDGLDPDCVVGDAAKQEEVTDTSSTPWGTTQCNDGIDNSTPPDGLIDSQSDYCKSGSGDFEG